MPPESDVSREVLLVGELVRRETDVPIDAEQAIAGLRAGNLRVEQRDAVNQLLHFIRKRLAQDVEPRLVSLKPIPVVVLSQLTQELKYLIVHMYF